MRLLNPQPVAEKDRGATLLLVAISMLVLMGFAAVAVDSGILFSDRRQQQSAADVGALAAVQFAKTSLATVECTGLNGAALAACRGAEEAIDVVDGTLPGRYTLNGVDGDWDTCVDASKPAEFTIASSLSDCISFTANFQKARVVLPGTDVETSFARVIGVNTVPVGAFAEAGLDLSQSADVWPFAVGPSGAGSDEACFFAQSSGGLDLDPCTGPTEGNFGKLSLRLYGNTTMNTPQICSGGTAQRMSTNIVLGSDHPLELVGDSPGIINDDANCPVSTNPVDEVETWTGNASGALADGLFDGIGSPAWEGRLACKDGDATENPAQGFVSSDCVVVNSDHPEALDHTPLWDFIIPGANSEVVGGACAPGGGAVTNRAEMKACLAGWNAWPIATGLAHTMSLFEADLSQSTRFAAVPILDNDPGGGFSAYTITEFRPVYMETLYLGCNANRCNIVHSPGEDTDAAPPPACPNPTTAATTSCGWPWPGTGNQGVWAVSSFMLTLDMLDPTVAENFPSRDGTIIFNLSK